MRLMKPLMFIIAAIVVVIIISTVHFCISTDPLVRKSRTMFAEWHECFERRTKPFMGDPRELWIKIKWITKLCEAVDEMHLIPIVDLKNLDETKHHIIPLIPVKSTIITLGVGEDIKAEQALAGQLANVSFFGADPQSEKNSPLYSEIGHFFPFAVGAGSGIAEAVVLEMNKYVPRTVVHIDLVYFLRNITKTLLVDNLWMDTEGAEYGMMPYFYRGGELDQNGITVCQLYLEVHDPNDRDKKKLHDFVFRILSDGRYAMIRPHHDGHYRVFLINMEHPECVRRYIVLPDAPLP